MRGWPIRRGRQIGERGVCVCVCGSLSHHRAQNTRAQCLTASCLCLGQSDSGEGSVHYCGWREGGKIQETPPHTHTHTHSIETHTEVFFHKTWEDT